MKKIFMLLVLIAINSIVYAKQYVVSGKYFVDATNRVAQTCEDLIKQGYHIDCLTVDVENGRYIIIYSDKDND